MSPTNPTPARIEAARLLKKLNDDDHKQTPADVLELSSLNPDDYRRQAATATAGRPAVGASRSRRARALVRVRTRSS